MRSGDNVTKITYLERKSSDYISWLLPLANSYYRIQFFNLLGGISINYHCLRKYPKTQWPKRTIALVHASAS